MASYGGKGHLKHTTSAYIREISMAIGEGVFAVRCNSILRGKEFPQAKAHLVEMQ